MKQQQHQRQQRQQQKKCCSLLLFIRSEIQSVSEMEEECARAKLSERTHLRVICRAYEIAFGINFFS